MLANDLLLIGAKENKLSKVKQALESYGPQFLSMELKRDEAYLSNFWVCTSCGWNALHWAAYHGNTQILELLIDALKKNGTTIEGHNGVLNIQTAAPYKLGHVGNQTPAYIAVTNKKIDAFRLLIDMGADLSIPDSSGKSSYDYYFNLKEYALNLSDDNRVTIRVWESDLANGTIGHTSLQTYGNNAIYASFWPDITSAQPGGRDPSSILAKIAITAGSPVTPRGLNLGGIKGTLIPNSAMDERLEWHIDTSSGREVPTPPKFVVDLYSLNTAKIKEAFENFKYAANNSLINWAATPNIQGLFGRHDTSNCSGLVLLLLNAGEIQKIIASSKYSMLKAGLLIGGAAGGLCVVVDNKKASKEKIIKGIVAGAAIGGTAGSVISLTRDIANGTSGLLISPSGINHLANVAKTAEIKQYKYGIHPQDGLISLDSQIPSATPKYF
ncbi:MAG: ankyrin repeat domain-containing protein [Gammaproteobacteria bacterium]|nr:ankyrin repeat domain-containing protein [Gammaproteobacteria bacterium]